MLISGLFILLFISAISGERINGIIIYRAAALVLLYSFILSIYTLNVSIIGSGIGVYGGLYQITVLSKIIESFIYLLGAMILANLIEIKNLNFLNQESSVIKSEFPLLALFTVIGSVLLINSNDLISMYLSIELQSFGLYVLATLFRDSQSATYAGLKYFLLGGLSSGFILLGSAIIYGNVGVTNLESIYLLMSEIVNNNNNSINNNLLNYVSFDIRMGLIIMIVGFLFKIASAPFHNWAPDVYDGVPTKVTIWLSVMAKISILTFILDLVIQINKNQVVNLNESFSKLDSSLSLINIILIASILSLLIGTIVGLAQSRIKRLLAYSTISHVGFLLLAIGINTQDSTESFIFYLIQYSLTTANAFFILIAIGTIFISSNNQIGSNEDQQHNLIQKEYSPIQFINQLTGIFNSKEPLPLLALSFTVVLFSMAGIPPLIGFFAKQAVLLSAVKSGYIFMAITGIITSVISAAYYLRIIKVMIFDKKSEQLDLNKQLNLNLQTENQINNEVILSNTISFSISLLTVLIIFFVLKPTLILNMAHIMALSIFYI